MRATWGGFVLTMGTGCASGNGLKTVYSQADCGSRQARKNKTIGNASSMISITE
jgi:hypothetical protein